MRNKKTVMTFVKIKKNGREKRGREDEREMKVDRAQIGCIIVWPEAGESAIGCAVSRNTIAKGPLPPSHAGDIERICRELRKVQSAEKTADKTRSEPPGGVE